MEEKEKISETELTEYAEAENKSLSMRAQELKQEKAKEVRKFFWYCVVVAVAVITVGVIIMATQIRV